MLSSSVYADGNMYAFVVADMCIPSLTPPHEHHSHTRLRAHTDTDRHSSWTHKMTMDITHMHTKLLREASPVHWQTVHTAKVAEGNYCGTEDILPYPLGSDRVTLWLTRSMGKWGQG